MRLKTYRDQTHFENGNLRQQFNSFEAALPEQFVIMYEIKNFTAINNSFCMVLCFYHHFSCGNPTKNFP